MATSQHDDLPVPGYDQLAAGEIQHRIRSLEVEDLRRLLDHEREHADRVQVTEVIKARLGELDAGATPSPGGSPRPGQAEATRGGSPVDPATTPQPFSSPPHGSPHQRGKPKGDERRP
ncbi:hypothetical protein GCM10009716_42110 [Streptomyces sodiiphilus]|uniref:DUF8129 domain-containing protein n=1 Tax=Streptomyces sodiiphilus TaxID=226217 RepID=A0ABP5B466_9ACTN